MSSHQRGGGDQVDAGRLPNRPPELARPSLVGTMTRLRTHLRRAEALLGAVDIPAADEVRRPLLERLERLDEALRDVLEHHEGADAQATVYPRCRNRYRHLGHAYLVDLGEWHICDGRSRDYSLAELAAEVGDDIDEPDD